MSNAKPSETILFETKRGKVVGRNVAIVLGIVCILLTAGLGGVIAYNTMTVSNKDATYNDYVSVHTHSNSDYDSLSSQNTNLQNQVNNLSSQLTRTLSQLENKTEEASNWENKTNSLTKIVNLNVSMVWVDNQTVTQPAGGLGFSFNGWTFGPTFAGYVSVDISSANSTTYVEVTYNTRGVYYDNQINVGTNGTAVFPVLPTLIVLKVGNKNLIGGATQTVTITYTY